MKFYNKLYLRQFPLRLGLRRPYPRKGWNILNFVVVAAISPSEMQLGVRVFNVIAYSRKLKKMKLNEEWCMSAIRDPISYRITNQARLVRLFHMQDCGRFYVHKNMHVQCRPSTLIMGSTSRSSRQTS